MTRWIAILTLLVLAVAMVAPVVAPTTAFAATSDPGTADLPPVPWAQVWNWIKTFGPMLIYLVDAVLNAVNGGGGGAPNPPPPPPPPSDPSIITPTHGRTAPIAWCEGALAHAGACA